eukprot:gene861-495_t
MSLTRSFVPPPRMVPSSLTLPFSVDIALALAYTILHLTLIRSFPQPSFSPPPKKKERKEERNQQQNKQTQVQPTRRRKESMPNSFRARSSLFAGGPVNCPPSSSGGGLYGGSSAAGPSRSPPAAPLSPFPNNAPAAGGYTASVPAPAPPPSQVYRGSSSGSSTGFVSTSSPFYSTDAGYGGAFAQPTAPPFPAPSAGGSGGPMAFANLRPPNIHHDGAGGPHIPGSAVEQAEQENDVLLAAILGSVRKTRAMAEDIGSEIQSQNAFLEQFQTVMHKASASMKQTMRRLQRTSAMSGFVHIWLLFLFIGAVMFFVYVLLKKNLYGHQQDSFSARTPKAYGWQLPLRADVLWNAKQNNCTCTSLVPPCLSCFSFRSSSPSLKTNRILYHSQRLKSNRYTAPHEIVEVIVQTLTTSPSRRSSELLLLELFDLYPFITPAPSPIPLSIIS